MSQYSSGPAEKDLKHDYENDQPALNNTPSIAGEAQVHDDVFGDITDEGPNYRAVGWIGTVALMMKTQVGLGVLSIPAVFDVLGILPGIICLIVIAAITTWSDYMIGVFKRNHPQIYGIDDAGFLIFGRVGREIFGIAFCLFWIFVAGSGMLGISIGLNAVSLHGTCTAVFVAVAAICGFLLASVRTLGRISMLAWVGLVCIMTAIFTVTIAVGVQDRPAAAPQEGHWKSDWKVVGNPSFTEAISSISSLIFAYAGTPGFFAIAAEMKRPEHYTRSLLICQTGVTITYIVIGCVVYLYCGSYVASPALGSAGHLIKRVAYGISLPRPSRDNRPRHSLRRQIRLRPPPPRNKASLLQQRYPLGNLARLHHHHHRHRLPDRLRYSCLWWSCLPRWCPARHAHVVPAVRLHVAV
ncbi:hypothetical protein NW765_001623 [Fusarium oxysporum]|nr:hypothetical protein NW765_001623 [Fusarium oxysporum]